MYVWLVMMIDGCVLVLLIYAFYQVILCWRLHNRMQPLMYPIYMPFLTSIVMIIVGWSSQKAKTGSTLPCAS
jgi:hypothetical protein